MAFIIYLIFSVKWLIFSSDVYIHVLGTWSVRHLCHYRVKGKGITQKAHKSDNGTGN